MNFNLLVERSMFEVVVSSPVETPNDAMRVVFQSMLKHMADFQAIMFEVIAEHYDICPAEMYKVVTEHPRYKAIIDPPVVADIIDDSCLKTKKGKKVVIKKKRTPTPS